MTFLLISGRLQSPTLEVKLLPGMNLRQRAEEAEEAKEKMFY
jgi:hypothetical protein